MNVRARILKPFIGVMIGLTMAPPATLVCLSAPQEGRVNQKKIEREREAKRKKDRKEYEKAVKRHKKMQTNSTKASMKQTKKESAKATPTKH